MHPTLIDFGFFQLGSYGVVLVVGIICGLWRLKVRADANNLDGMLLVDFSIWALIWALVGSKALLVIVELPRYIKNPSQLLGIVRVGGVFLGGLIAAVITAAILLRRYKLRFLDTLDVICPSVALGHAIGRVGCLLAGCCWGSFCELPWAMTYTHPDGYDPLGTPLGITVHPFPVYSMIFNFSLYLGLAYLYRHKPAPGRVFATYLVIYGLGRFLLELARGDHLRGFVLDGLLSTSQAISLGLILTGAALHAWLFRNRAGK